MIIPGQVTIDKNFQVFETADWFKANVLGIFRVKLAYEHKASNSKFISSRSSSIHISETVKEA